MNKHVWVYIECALHVRSYLSNSCDVRTDRATLNLLQRRQNNLITFSVFHCDIYLTFKILITIHAVLGVHTQTLTLFTVNSDT